MNKFIITILRIDADGTYYNNIIEREFTTRESAMNCIDKCVEKEVENLKNMATKVVVKEHRNGKQVWAYGLCLIDYEIREIREK